MMRVLPLGMLLAAVVTAGFADTITLKNGNVVTGTFLGGTAREVRFDLGDRVRTFDVGDIARIDFNYPVSQPAPPPPPPPPPPVQEAPPPAEAMGITLPAGTNITIRMIDGVDSETAHVGQTFAASLDAPVTDPDGNTLIPRSADVVVKLVDAKQSGKISGRTELALALTQIRVNGQFVDINSQTVSQKSSNRAGRSAATIGGGAIGGAILGGILGGGKGAAIGATAGAAGGTAVELATSGQRVRVPSETRLTFVLDNAVSF